MASPRKPDDQQTSWWSYVNYLPYPVQWALANGYVMGHYITKSVRGVFAYDPVTQIKQLYNHCLLCLNQKNFLI